MTGRRLSTGFIRTRIGRRTLSAFLLAALLPAVVVAYVGQSQVRRALVEQARDGVLRVAQSSASVLTEQLGLLASDTTMRAYGSIDEPFDVDDAPDAYRHLLNGGALIDVDTLSGQIALRRRLPNGKEVHWTSATLNPWSVLDRFYTRASAGYCVFELRTWRRMHCSSGFAVPKVSQQLRVIAATQKDGASQIASAWIIASQDIFLRSMFANEPWRMVAVESLDATLAPASNSANAMMVLLLVASLTALALGHIQVRRSTKPLEALRTATREVMAGDFDARVQTITADEYGEVGTAFNAMAEAVGRQVTLMRGLDAVDEVTMRARRSDAIVDTAIEQLQQACHGGHITITTLDNDHDNSVTIVHSDESSPQLLRSRGQLDQDDRRSLLASGSPKTIVLPLQHDHDLLGVIELGFTDESADADAVLSASRRMADRVALGLANVRFLDQLEALSTGTLLAFARAIDANSRWTAGHSERVTAMAVRLGEVLELPDADLERLHRGGLMHDIGKIGIPASILDKAEQLTPAEFDVIKRHPEIGEQILKVVPAFHDILTIVRHHHERFDGRGYPDGLAGDNIPFLARIAAVADVYDAMASDRPYRRGLTPLESLAIIVKDSGSHFDPVVVGALQHLSLTGELDAMRGLVQYSHYPEHALEVRTQSLGS